MFSDLGGATNPLFVDYLTTFADVLFREYGSKVKKWITVNEPFNYCIISYGFGRWAPGIKSPGVGDYLCGHHVLLSHASIYRLYESKYMKKFGGQVGIVLESPYYEASDKSVTADDHQRAMIYRLGWFAQPIFSSKGGYPSVMVKEIAERSATEGRNFSRLPILSEEWKRKLRGSADFLGLNYYTGATIRIDRSEREPTAEPGFFQDSGIVESSNKNWKQGQTMWLFSVPEGFRSLLNWIKNEYNNPKVFIAENGWSDDGRLEDEDRIEYFNSHLLAVAKAVNEDGCNVIGYTAWSLMDSYEWASGFTVRHGIYSINFTSPEKERIPKKSVEYFKKVLKSRSVGETV